MKSEHNKESIILISKDILLNDYLPVYGNSFWKTPNIDALANKGTIFQRHYTAAPSTAMAFSTMFSGLYPYQLNRKKYVHVDKIESTDTIFDYFENNGFENHIIWSDNYEIETLPFSNCYGSENTKFHFLDLNQVVGPHFIKQSHIELDEELARSKKNLVTNLIDEIASSEKKIFLWIHLPHVLLGRTAYGSDIDLLDDIVGHLRFVFGDDNIFITADHGHMNGTHKKYAYAFDVYEKAIKIPFITPKLENKEYVNFPTSHKQLKEILIKREIPKEEFIISDSAYYAQPNRKIAIIKGKYKYIFNKFSKKEELYDLEFDEDENINLLESKFKDPDRKVTYKKSEVFFYPHWDEVNTVYKELKDKKDAIWKNGSFIEELIFSLRRLISIPLNYYRLLKSELKK